MPTGKSSSRSSDVFALYGEDGTAAVEYGIVLGLIALAAIAGLTDLGAGVAELFRFIADALADAARR